MMTRAAVFLLAAFVSASSARADAPRLGLPIACELGKTCWVQQYVDHDPSSGAKDYTCGSQTYDGHDGTDIRLRDIKSAADVIASAAGKVLALRDGLDDRLTRNNADRAAVTGEECGNGVLIAHEDGWETQYCHLRRGSIVVKPGDAVAQGQKLGAVGYSGMAEFPHVHLSVRRDGETIDPFRNGQNEAQCGGADNPLWTEDALTVLAYKRSDVLALGFAPGPLELEALEEGRADTAPLDSWPAMVAYVWAINLEKGDTLSVRLLGPGGFAAGNDVTLDRAKAQYLLFSGKRRPPGGWPKGIYRASVVISNAGGNRFSQDWQFERD